jgi:hypothetical protein
MTLSCGMELINVRSNAQPGGDSYKLYIWGNTLEENVALDEKIRRRARISTFRFEKPNNKFWFSQHSYPHQK